MTNSKKALLYGLATVSIWSTVASAFKIALRDLAPLQLLLCACAVSIAALTGILLVQGKLGELTRLGRRETVRCALLGALNPCLYYTILFKAYDLLPAQEAQPINYTWAVTLSLLSVPLLGQKLARKDLGAILLSYLGVVVISTRGDLLGMHFSSLPGVALALASTVIWALYWIFNTKSRANPMAGLLLSFLTGFPLILAATLLFSELPTPAIGPLLAAAYVGLFEMGITFALWLTAMKYAAGPDGGGTARVANLIFLSPFLSLVFIHFLVGETIHPATVAGLAFILAGNALMQYAPKKRA
ncbi:DMT family transporter [Desulfovibrio sp. Huiquan2017]|uniref:DMT family transporter n=1 Tax=Desulfovibrio sp. Huiquan2017 TaxID=2816861 RepID=UPI001A936C6A